MALYDALLGPAEKSTLESTRRAQEARDQSAERLATGRRVNQVNDDPVDYYRAKALSDALSDLGSSRATIELDQSAVQTSLVGLDTLEDYTQQLKGIALAARSADSDEARAAYAEQYNQVRSQIDGLVNDTRFLGENVLQTSALDLGIGDASLDYNDFSSDADINAAINGADSALSSVRSLQSDYGNDLAILNVREEFNENYSNTLQGGVDKLVNADLNEEAAVQIAAQIRSDLSFQGQRILAQGDSLLLGLFQ